LSGELRRNDRDREQGVNRPGENRGAHGDVSCRWAGCPE
jgi:hypothetical protein